ncbi:MAG TPA: 23S rRNA (adenine(2030)-N(6))-methyltransferase RlmJ [Caulobacteraceae bacterium]|nr:23S rRNA (adenine(2030)-N(6))-methyltransferase RlmJ [Caulobacteraceae bacterium]
MNYRHHFHAGNFADLLKHGLVLQLLERLMADSSPLAVLDVHAGAGVYDIEGEAARRSGEAAKGVVRLMQAADTPPAFGPLKQAIRRLNPKGGERFYPGSPALFAERLRPGDRYLGCELRPDDHAALEQSLRGRPGARALQRDGYEVLAEEAGRGPRRLVLVDPPFERGDDYARTAEGVGRADGRPGDAFVIWTPLKDLETFDAFLGGLLDAGAENGLVVEARLKPLDDPLRMNGCALVILADPGVATSMFAPARAIADWIVTRLGDAGGEARVEPLD